MTKHRQTLINVDTKHQTVEIWDKRQKRQKQSQTKNDLKKTKLFFFFFKVNKGRTKSEQRRQNESLKGIKIDKEITQETKTNQE